MVRRRVGLQSVMKICPKPSSPTSRMSLFDPPGVEFVEEVVQQQDRFFTFGLGDQGILGEFESDQKRFLLSLRTVFAQGIAADAEYQIVAVDARSGESVDEILFPGLEQQLFERGVVQISERYSSVTCSRSLERWR